MLNMLKSKFNCDFVFCIDLASTDWDKIKEAIARIYTRVIDAATDDGHYDHAVVKGKFICFWEQPNGEFGYMKLIGIH